VAGWALVGALAAMVATTCIILFSGHIDVFLGSCQVFRSGRQVCTPRDPWQWAIPCAGVFGAVVGGIGPSIFWRLRIRLTPAPTIFD
jgi:hypothetical protein